MPQERTRKIVVGGILAAISIFLGITRWGFIPWFAGASLTIMHVPVIIGAVLEGPMVGLFVGLIFGLFSMIQASVPNAIFDPSFSNPLISILPRLFIGPAAWLVWSTLKRWPVPGLIAAGIAGSLTNTILVLGMLVVFNIITWQIAGSIAVVNGLPEAGASALITVIVVAAWKQIQVGRRKGSNL